MLSVMPFTAFILIIYNVVVFLYEQEALLTLVLQMQLPSMLGSEEVWSVYVSDLIVVAALCSLYIEVLKATRTSNASIVDHAASMVIFILYLLEFLLIRQAGNSTFFVLLFISLLDVIAGFTISLTGARRDYSSG